MAKKQPVKHLESAVDHEFDGLCLYRVLMHQPLSVRLDCEMPMSLDIQGTECGVLIRPEHDDAQIQREKGGSLIAIDFIGSAGDDLIDAARRGLSLIEDLLSAIALTSGHTYDETSIAHVLRWHPDTTECEFLVFKQLGLNHWQKAVAESEVAQAQLLLRHWHGLDDGKRLRRAALRYRYALGSRDDVTGFQQAYIGLEALEKPLAAARGIPHGVEEVSGECDNCHHKYTVKRTRLVGVRAFILDGETNDTAEEGRKADWKLINSLRNDLVHGLEDIDKIGDKPLRGLLAATHHLRSAIGKCSHDDSLTTEQHSIARGGPMYALHGVVSGATLPKDMSMAPIETTSFRWTPHPSHGFVPEINLRNTMGPTKIRVGYLDAPFTTATMKSLIETPIERSVS